MSDLNLHDAGDEFLRSGRVRFHKGLAPLMRRIDDVTPAPYNYNSGDVEMVQESIVVSGMYRPVYVQQATGHIIAGNHTWEACKALGSDVIPVVYLDVDDTQAKRIMVADNAIASRAEPDHGLLLPLLDEIEADAGDILGTGLTKSEMEIMRAVAETPLEPDLDPYDGWPTFSVQVNPLVLRAFLEMTDDAESNRERFELMMRMAGWQG